MPGHLGLLSNTINTSTNFIEGLTLLKYSDHHSSIEVSTSPQLSYGIVKNSKEITKGYYHGDHFVILIDGELYNSQPQWEEFNTCDDVVSFLKEADGYFSAVIFNKDQRQIILITDLFGIKPLYLLADKGLVAWSSEIKTLAKHSRDHSSLDQTSILAFLDLGFLPGNKTWYSDIQLLPAASITTIDIDTQTHSTLRYWSWNHSNTKSNASLTANLENLDHLLRQAVERRTFSHEDNTIALSGGLDSRLLLLLIRNSKPLAFTFGHEHSDDVNIAKSVCAHLGVSHQVYEYNQDNWLDDKIGSIWRTEGMMPFFHLHSSPFCQEFDNLGDTVFNGFGGATLLGGLFIGKSDKIKKQLSRYIHLDYDFYGKENPEAIVIDQHMRRFINQGSIDVGKYLVQRTPYMDRELVLFLLSLPDSQRKHYRIFHEYLRHNWPADINRIPWENTNMKITNARLQELLFTFKWPSIRRVLKLRRPAFDYPKLTDQKFQQLVRDVYLGEDAKIWSMMPDENKKRFQKLLFRNLQLTGRILSLEIWIRLIHGQIDADESFTRF